MVATYLNRRVVDMEDMIVCDSEIRLLLSKAIKKGSLLTPEVGQEIVLTAAVAATDTEIQVEPLIENIKGGTVLEFKNSIGTVLGTVTVSVPPESGDKIIQINAATASIANYSIATTDGVEQVLTLANAVSAGDRIVTLANPLTDWLEKGRILSFENGVDLVVKNKTAAGVTSVSVVPALFGIDAGDTSTVANYLEVFSINQLDDSSSANTLNERNFRSGTGTGKSVTSYSDTVTIGGNYIKGDFALNRLYNTKQDSSLKGYVNYGVIVEPEGGQDLFAKMWLGQHGNTRPNDQTKKISATLEVDGILRNFFVPRTLLQ